MIPMTLNQATSWLEQQGIQVSTVSLIEAGANGCLKLHAAAPEGSFMYQSSRTSEGRNCISEREILEGEMLPVPADACLRFLQAGECTLYGDGMNTDIYKEMLGDARKALVIKSDASFRVQRSNLDEMIFRVDGINGTSTYNYLTYAKYQNELKNRHAKGRYTLEEAALFISKVTASRPDEMQNKLKCAARLGTLPVYEPNRDSRYLYGEAFASRPRRFYEEAYYSDLNKWLIAEEPRLVCNFPRPSEPVLMPVPRVYELSEVLAQSNLKEESILGLGNDGEIIFLVVVPEIGACIVPVVALSYFMAGENEFTADAMPEFYNGTLSGRWTIKRDRLRILVESWEKYSSKCRALAASIEAVPTVEQSEQATPISNENKEPPCITDGMVTITKLAITAAWEIECEIKRIATVTEVIKRLQEWVANKNYPDLIEIIPHGVKWMTTAPDEKAYDVEACRKTLRAWHKNRAQTAPKDSK